MNASKFAIVKRGRSTSNSTTDADIIKLKRSETPDDIFSAILKEENVDKGEDDDENGSETEEDDMYDEEDSGSSDDDWKGHEHSEDEDGRRIEQPKRRVSHGCHLVEGKMKHGMEDYLVAMSKKMDDHELGLYAIFDGHSGRKVAEYLRDHLFENILKEPNFWTNPKDAVKRAYETTDNHILENVVGSRGGSTAVTAILIDQEKLVVANVGDSRAVMCKNGAVKQITVNHEPLKERKMVESKGGYVSQRPGNIPRVDGQLAMTRAFGDERLKDHITAEPDIIIETVDEDTEFMILASDGLWKVTSNEEAIDCIRGLNNSQEAAEELIREALLRESEDDISCVVVMFHDV